MTNTNDIGLPTESIRHWSEPLPYDELARDLTVRHIATAIGQLTVIEADDPVTRVSAVLEPNQFDFAPVRDSDGFVGRVALATAKRTKSSSATSPNTSAVSGSSTNRASNHGRPAVNSNATSKDRSRDLDAPCTSGSSCGKGSTRSNRTCTFAALPRPWSAGACRTTTWSRW